MHLDFLKIVRYLFDFLLESVYEILLGDFECMNLSVLYMLIFNLSAMIFLTSFKKKSNKKRNETL